MSKNFDDDVMSANCDAIDVFLFIANLEQSGSRIENELWSYEIWK